MKDYQLIDLTQPLYENMPSWDGKCAYCADIKKDYDQLFKVNRLEMDAGMGTHMDAPSHLFKEGLSIEQLEVDHFVCDLCMIDVSQKASSDYEISLDDLKSYEEAHGTIPKNSVVIGYTGWSRFWLNSASYRNADSNGQMRFPAFSKELAEALIKRDVAGIGIDTLSPDCLDSSFPVHRIMLSAGKYIIENIGDCSQVPPKGATIVALPVKLQGCSEAPARIIALIPK